MMEKSINGVRCYTSDCFILFKFFFSFLYFLILNYLELYAFLVGDNVNLQPDTGKAVL